MALSRREFLRAGVAATAGGLLLPRGLGALAEPLGPVSLFETRRESRLFPGTFVAHADLHNHSLHSDGDGDPAAAFGSMRDAGLDVAALTDHSTLSWGLPQSPCLDNQECRSVAGIDEPSWMEAGRLADAANQQGSFVALRGFEWSSPSLGHMNVWFSERWMDPLHTAGGGTGEGAAQFLHDDGNVSLAELALLDQIVRGAPTTGAGMAAFYDWLAADPSRPVVGGGGDGLASFNHPGREPGRFSYFRDLGVAPTVRERIVAMEIFNRRDDYVFEGIDSFAPSPLNECLNAGWRVGLSGVTDEHDTDWGHREGKGRTGVWVTELSRDGVREALAARRFFATRERGLRVDAAAGSVRMGGTLPHAGGPVTFALDVDRGPAWHGKELLVQVLRSGERMPAVQAVVPIVVPDDEQPPVSFTLPVDRADGDWVVLRISDPATPVPDSDPERNADEAWKGYGKAVAYCSPFFLS